MAVLEYKTETAGEALFLYVHNELVREQCWRAVVTALQPTGDGSSYMRYLVMHSSLYLSCKLICAAKSIVPSGRIQNSSSILGLVDSGPWRTLNTNGKLLRLLVSATENSDNPIPPGLSRSMMAHSRTNHSFCYICGTDLVYDDSQSRSYFTLDHLWPRCYGGESIEENLLPCCSDCNVKKDNTALWVATDIHASFFATGAPSSTLSTLKAVRKIALYQRAAMDLATEKGISLKRAYIKLGPWREVATYDDLLVPEMFNMRIHNDLP